MKRLLSLLLVLTLMLALAPVALAKEPVDEAIDETDVIIEDIDTLMNQEAEVEIENTSKEIENLDVDDDVVIEEDENGQSRIARLAEIISRQIELKTEFVQNTKGVYRLLLDTKTTLQDIKEEIKDIRVSEDRSLDGKDFELIKANHKKLKADLRNAQYKAGDIAKESAVYIRHVKNRQFVKAVASFEKILDLQKQQIKLLETILEDALNLHEILLNV